MFRGSAYVNMTLRVPPELVKELDEVLAVCHAKAAQAAGEEPTPDHVPRAFRKSDLARWAMEEGLRSIRQSIED